jgi:hypothetical protein
VFLKYFSVVRCKPSTILHRYAVRSGAVVCPLQWPSTHKWWTSLVPTAGAHIAGRCAGTVPGGLLPHGPWRHVGWSSHHQHNFTAQVRISLQQHKKKSFLIWHYGLISENENWHVKRVPCHHGLARPQVADREDGLQVWRVAASILNKQSRIANKRCSSPQRIILLWNATNGLGLRRILWINDLS